MKGGEGGREVGIFLLGCYNSILRRDQVCWSITPCDEPNLTLFRVGSTICVINVGRGFYREI
jgi:hypothetical protein